MNVMLVRFPGLAILSVTVVNCPAGFAAAESHGATLTAAGIVDRASIADRIEVEDFVQPTKVKKGVPHDGVIVWTDEPPPIRHISIRGTDKIKPLVENLRLTVPERAHVIDVTTGKRVDGYAPRLSSPDYECRFFRDKNEVLRFTVHMQGAFIRIEPESEYGEFNLIPPWGARLDRQLRAMFVEHNHSQEPARNAVH